MKTSAEQNSFKPFKKQEESQLLLFGKQELTGRLLFS
jgi:hypothetical protein